MAFDPAFVAIRPDLVEALKAPTLFGNRFVWLKLPMENAPSKVLESLGTRKRQPDAIVASPLVARGLVEGAARNGARPPGPLVALEWKAQASASGGVALTISSDPLPAYRLVGQLFGGLLDDYRRGSTWSGSPAPAATAALVFLSGPSRPQEALEAFTAGFSSATSFPPAVEVVGDEEFGSGSPNVIRRLLAGDLKAILLATGPSTSEGLLLLKEPGKVIGFASYQVKAAAATWPAASFVIHHDDAAIAAALRRPIKAGGQVLLEIPWRLDLLPGADSLASRALDLGQRLFELEKRQQ